MPETTISPDERHACLDGPIHGFFGLSYSNYLVLHRTLMQSMPVEWQERAVALFREYDDAFAHIEKTDYFDVTAGEEREIGELTDAQRKFLGVTGGEAREVGDEDEREPTYFYRGEEYQGWERIIYPKDDPVPPYNRGRTFVAPRAVLAEAVD